MTALLTVTVLVAVLVHLTDRGQQEKGTSDGGHRQNTHFYSEAFPKENSSEASIKTHISRQRIIELLEFSAGGIVGHTTAKLIMSKYPIILPQYQSSHIEMAKL